MAYLDRKEGMNQRAGVMIGVALLEGAAIIAIVNGLSVNFIRKEPPPPMPTSEWRTDPLPPLPPKPPENHPRVRPSDTIVQPLPPVGPFTTGPVFPDPPVPTDPTPVQTGTIIERPPAPAYDPVAARPVTKPGTWVTPSDYPARDLREGNQGRVGFTLTIGSDGTVQNCVVTQSSGFASLDEATCPLIQRRARFNPAKDGDGKVVTGTYSNAIKWVIPDY